MPPHMWPNHPNKMSSTLPDSLTPSKWPIRSRWRRRAAIAEFVIYLVVVFSASHVCSALVVYGIIDRHSTAVDWARVADFCFTFRGNQHGKVTSQIEVGSVGHELSLVGNIRSILNNPSLVDYRPQGVHLLQRVLLADEAQRDRFAADGEGRGCLEGTRSMSSSLPRLEDAAVRRQLLPSTYTAEAVGTGSHSLGTKIVSSSWPWTQKSSHKEMTTGEVRKTSNSISKRIKDFYNTSREREEALSDLGLEHPQQKHWRETASGNSVVTNSDLNPTLNTAAAPAAAAPAAAENRNVVKLAEAGLVSNSPARTLIGPSEGLADISGWVSTETHKIGAGNYSNIKYNDRPPGTPIVASTVCQALRETAKITEQLTLKGERSGYLLVLLVEPTLSPPDVTAVITRCGQQPWVAYRIEMTNPGGFLTAQFSCHDQGLLELFGLLTIVCAACGFPLWRLFRYLGYARKESPVIDVFYVGILSMATYIFTNFLHLTIYASNGTGAIMLSFLGNLAYTGFLAAACGTILLLLDNKQATGQRWRRHPLDFSIIVSGTGAPTGLKTTTAAVLGRSEVPGTTFRASSNPIGTVFELLALAFSRAGDLARYILKSAPKRENLIVLLFSVWFFGFLVGWITGDPTREPLTPLWRFLQPHRIRFYAISNVKGSLLLIFSWLMVFSRVALAGHFFLPSMKFIRRLAGEYDFEQKRQFQPQAITFVWLLVLPIVAICSPFLGRSHMGLLLCSSADIAVLLLFALELKRNPYFLATPAQLAERDFSLPRADDQVADFEKVGLVDRIDNGVVPPSMRVGDQDQERHQFPIHFPAAFPGTARSGKNVTERRGTAPSAPEILPPQRETLGGERKDAAQVTQPNPLAAVGEVVDGNEVAPPLLDMTAFAQPQIEPGRAPSRAAFLGATSAPRSSESNNQIQQPAGHAATTNEDPGVLQSFFGTSQQ